jgi:hypothetical protein
MEAAERALESGAKPTINEATTSESRAAIEKIRSDLHKRSAEKLL